MKTTIEILLTEYGESHQNATNKTIHWICVPLIFFNIFGLLRCIPVPTQMIEMSSFFNWSNLMLAITLIYYLRLSKSLFLAFIPWALFVALGNEMLFVQLGSRGLLLFSLISFALAWVGQFIGHGIEGKKPSFLKDIQFLLIGPAWLLNFLVKAVKI